MLKMLCEKTALVNIKLIQNCPTKSVGTNLLIYTKERN